MLTLGLLAAVTSVGVYSATAGGGDMVQPAALGQADQVAAKVGVKNEKVIRIVGPQFFPDNGDIRLVGAAVERAKRG